MSNYDRKVFSTYHTKNSIFYSFILILIIAIPISVILYLTLQGPITFSALMFSTLIGLLILLSYLAASSKNNKYEITNNLINIKFGPLQKSFNYSQIIKAEIINLKLILRIFGASLPGFHWGLFKTNIGNAHIYATRIEGQFILLTLNDGEKIALSPEQPREFLNAIEERKNLFNTQPTSIIKQKEQTKRTIAIIQVIAVTTAYIIFLAYFTWVYIQLPQIVPLHIGFNGVPNRFGDKTELLWVAGIAATLPIINAILRTI